MIPALRVPAGPDVIPGVARLRRVSLWLALIGILCLLGADLSVTQLNPWQELGRLGAGLLQPSVWSWRELVESLATTLAFALQGVTLGALLGFTLALGYRRRWVRLLCSFLRSVHELFWALLFLQVFGLSPLTGLLALLLPYTGTLAKIYGELLEEADPAPQAAIAIGTRPRLDQFVYAVLPLALKPMLTYTSYRLECAIRSSVVLGFVGLPTLGFHLETVLKQGHYSEAAALIYATVLLIMSLPLWLKPRWTPVWIVAAFLWLPPVAAPDWSLAWRFLSEDLVPAPWRGLGSLGMGEWMWQLGREQILPGVINTLLVGQAALLLAGLVALAGLPLNSALFFPGWRRRLGDTGLIVLRSLPEYLLNLVGLLLLGPSMLPAILALGVHNGAIIGHLLGRATDQLRLREDAPEGLMGYCFEVVPRLYRQFLAYLFYRWEIILRETAMLGLLGIPTLGFYIDSAFAALFFDRALVLILASALLTMGVDQVAHYLRTRLHLRNVPETL